MPSGSSVIPSTNLSTPPLNVKLSRASSATLKPSLPSNQEIPDLIKSSGYVTNPLKTSVRPKNNPFMKLPSGPLNPLINPLTKSNMARTGAKNPLAPSFRIFKRG